MRNLILSRLEDYRNLSRGFDHNTMRWKLVFGPEGEHISDTNFRDLSDSALLTIYERVIIIHHKWM